MKRATKPRSEAGKARAVLADLVEQHPEVFPAWRRHRQLTITVLEATGTPLESTVHALVAIIDGPKRAAFEVALQRCLDAYVWPSAPAIHREMGREVRSSSEPLSGDECRWRREYLCARGWVFEEGSRGYVQLVAPQPWREINARREADERRAKRRPSTMARRGGAPT